MHISELKQSKFLTKEDCGKGILVTIKECYQANVAKEGAPPENKWCLEFNEQEKPMVLNSTNGQLIAQITGSENSEDWVGHKIVLYNDPSVSFAGQLKGGIRVRAPRNQPSKPAPAPEPTRGPLGKVRADVPQADIVPKVEPVPEEPIDDVPF